MKLTMPFTLHPNDARYFGLCYTLGGRTNHLAPLRDVDRNAGTFCGRPRRGRWHRDRVRELLQMSTGRQTSNLCPRCLYAFTEQRNAIAALARLAAPSAAQASEDAGDRILAV